MLLIFAVEETMIETQSRRKAVVPVHIQTVFETGDPKMPHFTAMLAANVIGDGSPPFVILTELKNLSYLF